MFRDKSYLKWAGGKTHRRNQKARKIAFEIRVARRRAKNKVAKA